MKIFRNEGEVLKKKINAKFILISAIAIMVTGICTIISFYDILKEQIFEDLEANACVLSMINPKLLAEEIPVDLNNAGIRITMIEEDGSVIYDSLKNELEMENHANREEITQAKKLGEGRAVRISVTSNQHTFYYAMKTERGMILRIAKTSDSIYTLIAQVLIILVGICIAVLILCLFWASRLTRNLITPIEKLAENITMVDETDVYEEMRPFVETIKAKSTGNSQTPAESKRILSITLRSGGTNWKSRERLSNPSSVFFAKSTTF